VVIVDGVATTANIASINWLVVIVAVVNGTVDLDYILAEI